MERERDETTAKAARDGTIVPVRRPFRQQPGKSPARARRTGTHGLRSLVALTVALGLLGGVYAVFVWLPAYVAGPVDVEPAGTGPVAEIEPEPVRPELTEDELDALRDQTERRLSQLLRQQSRVAQRSPQQWAADDWERYASLARAGDDAYLANEYWNAVPLYGDALALGETLLQRADEIVEASLAAGERALADHDHEEAIRQFGIVLVIDADDSVAQRGIEQAEKLPELVVLLEAGHQLREQDRLADAVDSYRAALALDGGWTPARQALSDTEAGIAQRAFDAVLSRGYAAIADENFTAAERHFREALAMRPNSEAARDGLTQAEQGRLLGQIALAEVRALAFEARELWGEAINQYRAALATDPTLEFARSGLARALPRDDLDTKITFLIDNPSQLFSDAVLQDARRLLAQARELDSPAGRLEEQVGELSRLVEIATTPIQVQLVSDQRTEVTLYRVGSLGTFDATTVELRPGTYTAVGSRTGYRDVRHTFTVLPGRTPEPVTVTCMEPI